METIRGLVTKIMAKSEERGSVFAMINYDTPLGLNNAKMSAFSPDLQAGDYFIADGTWRTNTYKGKTEEIFNVKFIRPHLPEKKESALSWFLTIFDEGRHGVTAESAKSFIQKYGDNVAQVCERNLEIIPHISSNPNRYKAAILRDWGRRVSGRKAVKLLEDAGVTKNAIESIIDAFRDSAFEVLNDNPYRAARIPKFGFPNADLVGTKIGISKTDDRRITAAILESINSARMSGHTYIGINEICEMLGSKFQIDTPTATNFLIEKIHDTSLPFVIDVLDGKTLIAMDKDLGAAEEKIASNIVARLKNGRKLDQNRVDSVLDYLFTKEKFKKFDPIQRAAVATAVVEPICVLTGGPGTGKSTVTEAIVDAIESIDKSKIFLCAPTGKAADRLSETTGREASTLHTLLGAREDKQTGGSVFEKNASNPLPAGCRVIVDEASMIDATTAAALLEALPPDGKLLLVGDKNQLPSVDAGNFLNDILSARRPDKTLIVPRAEIVNVYRQSNDSAIATGAALVRQGEVPPLTQDIKGGVALYEHVGDDVARRILWVVEQLTKKRLSPKQISILIPQSTGSVGTNAINLSVSKLLNPKGEQIPGIFHSPNDPKDLPIPRVGDRVMLTDNDLKNKLMNGDIGTITGHFSKMSGQTSRPHFKVKFDNGKEMEYPSAMWRLFRMAYATTIHKSQGSQYKAVIMPVVDEHHFMLDRTILYTGWTRAKEMLFLIGQREAIQSAVDNVEKSLRNTRLQNYLSQYSISLEYHPKAWALEEIKNTKEISAPPQKTVVVTPKTENKPAVTASIPRRGMRRPFAMAPKTENAGQLQQNENKEIEQEAIQKTENKTYDAQPKAIIPARRSGRRILPPTSPTISSQNEEEVKNDPSINPGLA